MYIYTYICINIYHVSKLILCATDLFTQNSTLRVRAEKAVCGQEEAAGEAGEGAEEGGTLQEGEQEGGAVEEGEEMDKGEQVEEADQAEEGDEKEEQKEAAPNEAVLKRKRTAIEISQEY